MSIDTSGTLLEGIKVSSTNSEFGYPPDSEIFNSSLFNTNQGKAEYIIQCDGKNYSYDISSPELYFLICINKDDITRFDYNNSLKRWDPKPGSTPQFLGKIGNNPRLKSLRISGPTVQIYCGSPKNRIRYFNPVLVDNDSKFGNPGAGNIEISRDKFEINFGDHDISDPDLVGRDVFSSHPSFIDRQITNGFLSFISPNIQENSPVFLSPKPISGDIPRIRLGGRKYLDPIQVQSDSLLGSPSPGTFSWSLETGRVRFSDSDILDFDNYKVYYDGVFNKRVQLSRKDLGNILSSYPNPGLTDNSISSSDRILISAYNPSIKSYHYFKVIDFESLPDSEPEPGSVYFLTTTGHYYFSLEDYSLFSSFSMYSVDTLIPIENGFGVRVFRSLLNEEYGYPISPDFSVGYNVISQTIQNSLLKSPYVSLPNIPVDNENLSINVFGESGSFSGSLHRSGDKESQGLGFNIDFDQKSLKFTNRVQKSIISRKSTSSIKLPDSAILGDGFSLNMNGNPIISGNDFSINEGAGLIEFTTNIGSGDGVIKSDIKCIRIFNNRLKLSDPVFDLSMVGFSILSDMDGNSNLNRIIAVVSSSEAVVDGTLYGSSGTCSIVNSSEIIADKFYRTISPEIRKFKIYSGTDSSNLSIFHQSSYSVSPDIGQIILQNPSPSGVIFRVDYSYKDSSSGEIKERSEYASFKIRQEAAIYSPGDNVVTFNIGSKTVNVDYPIVVSVDGVTRDEDSYSFIPPNKLSLGSPLSNEVVNIDYFVIESKGGETSFKTKFGGVIYDNTIVSSGNSSVVVNGDFSHITPGSVILFGGVNLAVVSGSSYSSQSSTTTISTLSPFDFEFRGDSFELASEVLSQSNIIQENENLFSNFTSGTDVILFDGSISSEPGTIFMIGGDPYLCQSSAFDSKIGKTRISFTTKARRSYVLPKIFRSLRPVFHSSGKFRTSYPVHLDYPFVLIRNSSSDSKKLIRNEDFTISDGGDINLEESIQDGNSLKALYVARRLIQANSNFNSNYSYMISPDADNGLFGQSVSMSYDLHSPDTFYVRTIRVGDFIPEVIEESKKSSGSSSSGPNIKGSSSLKNQDYGGKSFQYDFKHTSNIDIVSSRILGFYSDIVNFYEDLRSCMTGRLIGGNQGKFKFNKQIPGINSLSLKDSMNHIDDSIRLYDKRIRNGLFGFTTIPVYSNMWEYSPISRLFPTSNTISISIGGNVLPDNFGEVIADTGIENIKKCGSLYPSSSSSRFHGTSPDGLSIQIEKNGDDSSLSPPLVSGDNVTIRDISGRFISNNVISSIGGDPPFIFISLNNPVSIRSGIISRESNPSSPSSYVIGRDVGFDFETGQVLNNTFPPPDDEGQISVLGNEIRDAYVTFNNSDSDPRRIPVLDGHELDDSGRFPVPYVSPKNELNLISELTGSFSLLGSATVNSTINVVSFGTSEFLRLNDVVRFTSGPNSSIEFTVSGVLSGSSVTVSPSLIIDNTPREYIAKRPGVLNTIQCIDSYISLIESDMESPAQNAIVGNLNSEIFTWSSLCKVLSDSIVVGSGSTTQNSIIDNSRDFISSGVKKNDYIFIESGPMIGLYKIESVFQNSLNIVTLSPFHQFPIDVTTSYEIVRVNSLSSHKDFEFASDFISSTIAYLSMLKQFRSTLGLSIIPSMISELNGRIQKISSLCQSIDDNLRKNSKYYDSRYSWINQRTNRKTGTLSKKTQSQSQMGESIMKAKQNARKNFQMSLIKV
jgi:hypothetical protein